jgi:2-keto-4-pentenoate hydratase/2-oxohepta-3-ene-1,7-dioic acid hydratase in catechol pathway
MKLARMDGRYGLVRNDRFTELTVLGLPDLDAATNELFQRWSEVRAALQQADPSSIDSLSTEVAPDQLEAPVGSPRQIFALALNYADHAAEASIDPPEYPLVFPKYPSCITGPHAPLELGSNRVDWEVELVAVVGTGGFQIAEKNGWDALAGVTVGQDLSDRRIQARKPMPHFALAKSGPTYGPLGPVLVTPDEFPDPDDLEIRCEINGEVMQRSRTSQLIFSVPRLVAEISSAVRLEPGDLIFTGTPSGVGSSRNPRRYLEPGDEIVSTVEGIGSMRNTCQARP